MKKILYIIIGVLTLSACNEDFLDVVPTGMVIPKTVEDYDKMLLGIRYYNSSPLFYMNPDVDNAESYDSYWWSDELLESSKVDGTYNGYFSDIFIDNTILENIETAELGSTATETDRIRIKRDAMADRAAEYFLLVNTYAPHYNPATAATDLTIPIKTNSETEEYLSNATVQEVYDFIIKDLKTAYDLVDDESIPKNRTRPSRAGITALLAKVYLYMGDYEKALKYADECLGYHSYIYDYNDVEDPSDARNELPKPYYREHNIWIKSFKYSYAWKYYTDDFLSIFDEDNDLRYEMLLKGRYGLFNLFGSVQDVLLIRAECYAHTNKIGEAMADVNTLRVKRISKANFWDNTDPNNPVFMQEEYNKVALLSATNKDDALDIIATERRRETAGSGAQLWEYKRYYVEGRTIPTFTRMRGTDEYKLEPGSTKYYIDISQYTLDNNPNLKPNK